MATSGKKGSEVLWIPTTAEATVAVGATGENMALLLQFEMREIKLIILFCLLYFSILQKFWWEFQFYLRWTGD
jgi:hypothetical protein